MTQFHHKVHEEKSYRRAIFLAVSLALAGVCSVYPVMCFKNYSTKEKDKLNSKVAQVERKAEDAEDPYAESPPPPSTPFLGEAFWQARQFAPETPGRGYGDVANEWQPSPPGARVRSGSGRGSPATPSRSPTAETVPSQLLGGRAGSDADVLMEDSPESPESSLSTADYHIACKVSTEAHLRNLLSPAWPSRPDLQGMAEKHNEEADSPPKTPASVSSSKSKSSNASSFAYLLRNNRADTRLLHKKSQPAAHLTKHTPLARKPVMPQRSPSYYKPKVVEDTLLPDVPSSTLRQQRQTASLTVAEFIKAADVPTIKGPIQRSGSPARTSRALRSVRSSDSPHRPESPLLLTPPISPSKRPALMRQPTMNDASKSLPLPPVFRVGPIKRPNLEIRESARSSTARPKHLSLPMPTLRKVEALPEQKNFHNVTPPEAEPTTPSRSHFQHGDHYFRTFGNNTVYMKAFTRTMIPTISQQPSPTSMTPLTEPVVLLPLRAPSNSIVSGQHKRKRSSVFRFLRKSAVTDSTYGTRKTGAVGARPSPLSHNPEIAVSPPFEPVIKRRRSEHTSSELSLPPYFAQPIRSRISPVATPSPLTSPKGTVVDPPAPRRMLVHRRTWSQKSSESSVSPGSQPRLRRPRLRHQATLADIADADMPAVVPDGQMVPAVPVTSNPGPRARFISMDRDEYHQSKATGTGTVHWLPHEGQHIRSPPENHPAAKAEGKRRSTFKRLLEDLRHTASVGSFKSEADTPGPAAIGQRGSILQHGSMATLLAKASKSSLNLLQSKASQVTVTSARRRESRERPELRVTNFHQTPYSQRVANTRRTELNQIKAYVEEALLDDDDDTIMGFELNVPDHLPSSPLCPLNPNHKRVGKAICPIHGRKKVRTPGLSKAKTMAASKSGGPRIVYEGVAGEADRRDTQVAGVDGGTSPRGKGETWYS